MNPLAFISHAKQLGLPVHSAVLLLVLNLLSTVAEVFGLGMLLPVFQYAQHSGNISELVAANALWQYLIDAYGWVGLDISLGLLLGTSFLAFILRQVFMYIRAVYLSHANLSVVRGLRRRAFDAYLSVSLDYHEQGAIGDFVNDIVTAITQSSRVVTESVVLTGSIIMLVVYTLVLMAMSWELTLAVMCAFLLASLLLRGILRRSKDVGKLFAESNQAQSRFLVERLRALRLIRLSGTQQAEFSAATHFFDLQYHQQMTLARLKAQLGMMIEPIVVGVGFVFVYLSLTVNLMTLEEVGLFILIALRLLPVIKQLLASRQALLTISGFYDALNQRFRDIDTAQEVESGDRPLEKVRQSIVFDDVRYNYPTGDVPALDGVTFEIPAGKITALVGPSGAGKSTLIDLLPRLRDPDTGTITIDGISTTDYSRSGLRWAVAYAPQSPQLFAYTIAEHIRYGRPNATMDEVRSAAYLSGALEFVNRLPRGFDTPIGEAGTALSGGQRQRLDLARALIRTSPILILDEPTSNLDADAEVAFRETLERLRAETDKTIIVVGHRLSSVTVADRIVVIRQGRVADFGTHEELLNRTGWYASAYRKQHPQKAA